MPLFRSRRPARSPRLAASAAASLLALLLAPAASAGEAVVAENGEWGSYGIQTQWIERDARPGDDFDRYVNGKWNASVEMPEDKTRIGAFITLRDLSEDRLKEILEELVSSDNPAGSPQARIAAAYGAYMDTGAIEAAGLAPARPPPTSCGQAGPA